MLRVLCLAARHDDDTLPQLEALLTIAQPVEFVRTIIGEGPPMWALLEALPTHGRLSRYVDRLLAAAQRVIPTAAVGERSNLVDALTQRELTVLRYLASRLDTSGIAEEMYLSANTVRSHVKSIYRKLGVSSRSDAVAEGRRLNLFAKTSHS